MADRIENIGARGARRRARSGWFALAIAGVVIVVLAVTHPPRIYRLILAIPVGLAALNFMQAREKT